MKARLAVASGVVIAFLVVAFWQTAALAEDLPDASMVAFRGRGGGRRPSQPRRPPEPPPKISEVTLTGVIDAVQGGGLKIRAGKSARSKDQKEWIVLPGPGVEVTIDGTATLDYLKKGQLVQFEGQIVNNTEVAGKVQEVTVLDKRTSAALAVKTKERGGGSGGLTVSPSGRIQAPKEDADSDALIGPEEPKKKGSAKTAPSAPVEAGPRTKIVGKIDSRTDNGFTVASGSKTLKVQLSDSPTINVQLSDPKLVEVGSKIVVQGMGAESKQGNQCMAKTIVVTLASPLSGGKPAAHPNKK